MNHVANHIHEEGYLVPSSRHRFYFEADFQL